MRILVIQTAFLGDIVLTTPLFRELRRVHPTASLWVVTTGIGRRLLGGSPEIDRLLVLEKRWDRTGIRSTVDLLRELAGESFDVAIAAQRSVRTGLMVRLSGAPLRVGFAGAPGTWAYNRRVAWRANQHAVQRYLDLAAALGAEPAKADRRPRLTIDPAADRRVRELLRTRTAPDGGELFCLAPGSARATKRWVPEGYAEVLTAARLLGYQPVLIGSPDERELCEQIASLAGERAPVLAGRTDVRELVALLARARVLVGNDSGAAHVASAVGTPVVSIFGATSPAMGYVAHGSRTRVVEHPSLGCRPCSPRGGRVCPLGHFRCMREIRASLVIEKITELLRATEPRRSADVATLGAA